MYTSLDAKKLAGLLDVEGGEEEMMVRMMSAKMAGRCVSRVNIGAGKDVKDGKEINSGGLLEGEIVATADLDFYIDQVSSLQFSQSFFFIHFYHITTERYTHCRINCGPSVRGLVYPLHRARAKSWGCDPEESFAYSFYCCYC